MRSIANFLGDLRVGNASITYKPLDISRKTFRILTSASLRAGEKVSLVNGGSSIDFQVVVGATIASKTALSWYTLSANDERVDIEALAQKSAVARLNSGEKLNVGAAGGWNVRSSRFADGPSLPIEARALGTVRVHTLSTRDISRTGMLIAPAGNSLVPFRVNTTLEITVDPKCSILTTPAKCLASVMRRGLSDGRSADQREIILGLNITEMLGEARTAWGQMVDTAEFLHVGGTASLLSA